MTDTISTFAPIVEKLHLAETPALLNGVYWFDPGQGSLRAVATAMKEAGARFVTITAYQLPADEGFRLEYHWDIAGKLLGAAFSTVPSPNGPAIDSICDIAIAVDWIEREIHEEYLIDFTGRPYEPLLVKPGGQLGINLREEATK